MSILDMFRSAPPTPVANAAPTATVDPAKVAADLAAAAAAKAAETSNSGAVATDGQTPLANFTDLWKIDANNKPVDPVAALSPSFNIDPVKVAEAAKSIDYSKLIPPDVMTKALGGDATAMAAMLNVVNQAATANAGMNTAKIVEAALANQAQAFMKILPEEVRKNQINMQIVEDHPIFANPQAAPLVAGLKDQFATKYPTATPTQISEFTANYLTDFVKAMGGTMPDPSVAAAKIVAEKGQQDWGNFFGVKF